MATHPMQYYLNLLSDLDTATDGGSHALTLYADGSGTVRTWYDERVADFNSIEELEDQVKGRIKANPVPTRLYLMEDGKRVSVGSGSMSATVLRYLQTYLRPELILEID